MAANKEELYRLIDLINDPVDLELASKALHSIIEHDDQSWYWSDGWRTGELEANEDIAAGRVSKPYNNVDELMRDLLDDGVDKA